ncbi:HAD-IC family P-type ATPase [Aliiglaciecola litoralis]|uniref:Cation-transporting P-type ATPase n=1 Tax=Aliiglaciecola litoralis TaxID=582857 RepID=A0ABN1LRU3_9ALTE
MSANIVPHNSTVDEVFSTFQSSEAGLSQQLASERLSLYGKNSLPLAPARSAWKRFFSQFHNVLIYVLIGSGVLSILLQHYVDSGVIFAVVLVNAIIGFIQEGKAENALRTIMSMTKSQCMVVRNGALESIDSSELVIGDVVMLQAGDRVPADIRLFFSKDFRCDESALTGEAQPVSKRITPIEGNVPLAERKNMAYMGTMVTYGLARGVVTHTALASQIGEISNLVGKVKLMQTPLQLQLARFAHQLTIGIIVVSVLTMVLGIFIHQYALGDMFQAAIGIAVSSIPEGLPAIVTIALAIGVQRMAKNNALVRRLPAVEVLGAVDVICSDKTGTLTANAMTAREVYTASGGYRISGEGYKPEGLIKSNSTSESVLIDHDSCFTQACVIALLCNDANIEHENGDWLLHGDPTEGALLTLALKHGLTVGSLQHDLPRIDILPFESEKRYMATLHHNTLGEVSLMVKGAPERLIDYASHQLDESGVQPVDKTQWLAMTADYGRRGMRVMALAMKRYNTKPDTLSHQEVESNLILVGLVGISDPPRKEAIDSIKMCHSAGIRVKMITGDSPVTAAAIGAELGLDVRRVLTGQEIDNLPAAQLSVLVEQVDVFARTSPSNKLQLVEALQKNRHVVAMTGDGVNDAPALKQANIGVAMGHKGTDAAKEAADFVLTDDNFSTIASAVREGRTVYDNIVKSIIFILPTNLAEALVIFTAIMLGRMMPITPAQILWVNMITAITLALALAFEHPEPNVMNKAPRPFGQGLFTVALLLRMVLVGVIGATIVFELFAYYRNNGSSIEYARAVAVNALVMIELFYLFTCRFLNQSVFSGHFLNGSQPMLIASAAVICLQLGFSYLPQSQQLFGLVSISLDDWLKIIVCTFPILLIVEVEKFVQRKLNNYNVKVAQSAT